MIDLPVRILGLLPAFFFCGDLEFYRHYSAIDPGSPCPSLFVTSPGQDYPFVHPLLPQVLYTGLFFAWCFVIRAVTVVFFFLNNLLGFPNHWWPFIWTMATNMSWFSTPETEPFLKVPLLSFGVEAPS